MGQDRRTENLLGRVPSAQHLPWKRQALRRRRRVPRHRIKSLIRAIDAATHREDFKKADELIALRQQLLRRLATINGSRL